MRVAARVPTAVVWAMALMFVVAVIGGVLEVWSLVVADVVVGSIVIVALARRWGRSLPGDLEAARAGSGTPPYIEPVWPRWFKIADPKFGGLLMAGLAIALTIFGVIAVLVSRL
jgi:hypothetical protein